MYLIIVFLFLYILIKHLKSMKNKMFKYCSNLSTFYNQHPSASSSDDGYIISADSSTIIGTPGILWENICFIEAEKLVWTHGEFFCQKDDKGNAKIFYGTCNSQQDYINKTVVCPDFTSADLVKGALIFVTFNYTNNADEEDIKLNVNNTGNLYIREPHAESGTITYLRFKNMLRANCTYLFTYDGTYWVLLTGDSDTDTKYSIINQSEAQTGTSITGQLVSAATLKRDIEYRMTQNQANWNETNNTLPSYILNKPEIPSIAGLASESYVNTKVADIVNSAPETLDTLNELAAALGNDPNFATTVSNQIGTKVSKTELAGLGYVTQITLSAQSYVSSSTLDTRLNNAGYISSIPFEYITQEELSANGYLTSQTKANWNETNSNSAAYIQNKPTIPAAANDTTITITKGSYTSTFTTNTSTAKTINLPNELPSYSSSESGKILSVNSSGQLVWITPVSIYSGNDAPNNQQGNNGDIYLQTD